MQNSIEVLTADIYVLFLILGEKHCLSVFVMMLTLVDVFYTLVKIPFSSCLAKTLFINIGFCQLVYLLLLRWLCCFSSQFDNMLKCAHWFSGVWNIWWLLKKQQQQQNATCIPTLNPTSSFFVLSLFYITGFDLLKLSFWRIFLSVLLGDFDLESLLF